MFLGGGSSDFTCLVLKWLDCTCIISSPYWEQCARGALCSYGSDSVELKTRPNLSIFQLSKTVLLPCPSPWSQAWWCITKLAVMARVIETVIRGRGCISVRFGEVVLPPHFWRVSRVRVGSVCDRRGAEGNAARWKGLLKLEWWFLLGWELRGEGEKNGVFFVPGVGYIQEMTAAPVCDGKQGKMREDRSWALPPCVCARW